MMSCSSSQASLRFPRVLVTGAAGFAGRHLAAELAREGHEVLATDVGDHPEIQGYCPADLCDRSALVALVRETRPDACIHLAAVSFVPDGDRNPSEMLTINIAGTVNLLEALRLHASRARLLLVSTAQVYGASREPGSPSAALSEEAPCYPLSLYAVSKVACERAAFGYGAVHGLDVLVARPANHTGPGQSPRFVAAAFARQVAAIAAGQADELRVGNLDAVRDFTDVRDVVRAYRLLIERGSSGSTYNISTNQHIRIGDLLDRLQALAGTNAEVTVDPSLFRPADASLRLEVARLEEATGWSPAYSIEDTLRDMIRSVSVPSRGESPA